MMMLLMMDGLEFFQGDANTPENSDDARKSLQTAKVQKLIKI